MISVIFYGQCITNIILNNIEYTSELNYEFTLHMYI